MLLNMGLFLDFFTLVFLTWGITATGGFKVGTLQTAKETCHNQGAWQYYSQQLKCLSSTQDNHGSPKTVWLPFKRKMLAKWTWINGTEYKFPSYRDTSDQHFCVRVMLEDRMLESVKCNSRRTAAMCDGRDLPGSVGERVDLGPSLSVILIDGQFTFYEARQKCSELGSDLAVLPFDMSTTDKDVESYLTEKFSHRTGAYWVGLTLIHWVTEDKSEVLLDVKWCDGEPDNGKCGVEPDNSKCGVVWDKSSACARTELSTTLHGIQCQFCVNHSTTKDWAAQTTEESEKNTKQPENKKLVHVKSYNGQSYKNLLGLISGGYVYSTMLFIIILLLLRAAVHKINRKLANGQTSTTMDQLKEPTNHGSDAGHTNTGAVYTPLVARNDSRLQNSQ